MLRPSRGSILASLQSLTELCFWHPVGPHVGESLEEIVHRKRGEISAHGFTLWSFAPATLERVTAWRVELARRAQTTCDVVCCGDSTRDPYDGSGKVTWVTESSHDLQAWVPVPPNMTNYHRVANRHGVLASGFVVTEIAVPDTLRVERPTRWLRAAAGRWEQSPVPTRGEYIVGAPAASPKGRVVRLLLRLRSPFVFWLK